MKVFFLALLVSWILAKCIGLLSTALVDRSGARVILAVRTTVIFACFYPLFLMLAKI